MTQVLSLRNPRALGWSGTACPASSALGIWGGRAGSPRQDSGLFPRFPDPDCHQPVATQPHPACLAVALLADGQSATAHSLEQTHAYTRHAPCCGESHPSERQRRGKISRGSGEHRTLGIGRGGSTLDACLAGAPELSPWDGHLL